MPLIGRITCDGSLPVLKGRRSPASWEEEAKRNEAMQWLGFRLHAVSAHLV